MVTTTGISYSIFTDTHAESFIYIYFIINYFYIKILSNINNCPYSVINLKSTPLQIQSKLCTLHPFSHPPLRLDFVFTVYHS